MDLNLKAGTLLAYIIAGLLIIPGIITTIVTATNWTYDEALEHLATEWSNKFERNVKYKISYEVGKKYQAMVDECEKKGYILNGKENEP